GRSAGVVRGGFPEGVEGLPARALRILGPQLVRLRVAADRRLLRHHAAAGRVEAAAERGQRFAAVRLDAEVVDARRAAGVRDREVDPRILEHPLGVVVLQHGGLGAEQLDRKSTRLNSSHVKISYAVFCLKKKRTEALR